MCGSTVKGSLPSSARRRPWSSWGRRATNPRGYLDQNESGWRAPGGQRLAEIGPPGPIAGPHTHPGPEAFYVLNGEQCLETPEGKMTTHAGESGIVRGDLPMVLTANGTDQCRSLVLILHDSSHRATTPLDNWTPQADRVKMRCSAVASVLQVTEDHEQHRVTPRIAPMITPVSPRGDRIRPVSAIRSGTSGRASQPG